MSPDMMRLGINENVVSAAKPRGEAYLVKRGRAAVRCMRLVRRTVQRVSKANQRSDPGDCLQRKVKASPEARAPVNPASFEFLFIAANNR